MAEILVGLSRVIKKGDLIKVFKVKEPLMMLLELLLLDMRGTKLGFSGLEVLRKCGKKNIKLLR